MKSLDDLAVLIREVNAGNGWNLTTEKDWSSNEYKIPAILALIHSEASEALEAFRHDDRENFMEELADIVIRVLDLAGAFTDDFQGEVLKKIDANRLRGHKHGGKRM